MVLCRSEKGESWDGRDRTVVFCERQTALCQSEGGESWDGRDKTVVVREGQMALCQSEEGESWDGRDQTVVFQVCCTQPPETQYLWSLPSTACFSVGHAPSPYPFFRLAQAIS
jgi:hypothetical protein